jgi:hypothetical protein
MLVRNGEAVGSILHADLTKTGKPRAGAKVDTDLLVSGSDVEDEPTQPARSSAPASGGGSGAASIRTTDVKGEAKK